MEAEEHQSVKVFRDYLRIDSSQPDPNYDGIVKFLQGYAKDTGFQCRVHEAAPNKPIVIMTVEGLKPELPSILLNSHTDVVTSSAEEWKFHPFSAHKTEEGDIYARGSQDMKCVGIQHVEALRELATEGVRLQRTVHVSFVPDEEIGGVLGMQAWVEGDDFRSMNVGFALDEGVANPGEEMRVFYSEKYGRWAYFVAKGNPGHGSAFLDNTAAPKIHKVMGKMLEFRAEQEARLKNDPSLTVGDVNSINIVTLEGGVQLNVVPDELKVGFDMRITPTEIQECDALLDQWATECDVTLDYGEYDGPQNENGITSTDPEDKWWKAFTGALNEQGVKYTKEIFQGGTDSRYLRNIGLPALGFSPMNHTPILLHDHNEYLNEKIFLRGVQIFKSIITAIGNVQEL